MIPKTALKREKKKKNLVSGTIIRINLVEAFPVSSQTLLLPYAS